MIRYTITDRPGVHEHVASWRGRCTYCGHRVGNNIIETRRQPWRIPSEIVHRYLAMRHTDRIKIRTEQHGSIHYETNKEWPQ